MPPGPVFHLCAVRQVHAVCCLHNQVILHIPHLILVNNLWGRHFTQLQTHSSLFSSEKHVSTGGSGPKRAALTGSQTEDWTPQRLIELSDISGCDFLTVFRSRFKPKEQRHPSPSTVCRTGLETVSDVIVPTLFETYARNCSYYTTASPVPRILLCTSDWWWQVLSTKQESISR